MVDGADVFSKVYADFIQWLDSNGFYAGFAGNSAFVTSGDWDLDEMFYFLAFLKFKNNCPIKRKRKTLAFKFQLLRMFKISENFEIIMFLSISQKIWLPMQCICFHYLTLNFKLHMKYHFRILRIKQ